MVPRIWLAVLALASISAGNVQVPLYGSESTEPTNPALTTEPSKPSSSPQPPSWYTPPLNYSSSAPHLFASAYGLLQQWPNTVFPNGHSLAAVTIPAFTLLYHGRQDADPAPPSPEWLALDLEMAYGIMGASRDSHLLTFQTTRPTQYLYLDGESAALMGLGQLDSQMLLLYGNVSGPAERDGGFGLGDEYMRARGLCDWLEAKELRGRGWGIEGVVRMNAGFEVIWCDFMSDSLRLLSRLNVTAPLESVERGEGESGEERDVEERDVEERDVERSEDKEKTIERSEDKKKRIERSEDKKKRIERSEDKEKRIERSEDKEKTIERSEERKRSEDQKTPPYSLPPVPTRTDRAADPSHPPAPPNWRGPGQGDSRGQEPFLSSQGWGWFESATWHYGSLRNGPGAGEARARVESCAILSFYGRGFERGELARSRGLDERKALNLTDEGWWVDEPYETDETDEPDERSEEGEEATVINDERSEEGEEATVINDERSEDDPTDETEMDAHLYNERSEEKNKEERNKRERSEAAKKKRRDVALKQLSRRRRYHHLGPTSEDEAAVMRQRTEDALRRVVNASSSSSTETTCSGAEWTLIMAEIVQRTARHLKTMEAILGNYTGQPLNSTQTRAWLSALRSQSHMFLVGYLEYPPNQQDTSAWLPRSGLFNQTLALCRYRYTRLLVPDGTAAFKLSPEEEDMRWAVEETYGTLCGELLGIGFDVERVWGDMYGKPKSTKTSSAIPAQLWLDKLAELIAWLGWESEFIGCSEVCAWHERCYIPMWPLMSWKGRGPGGPPGDDDDDKSHGKRPGRRPGPGYPDGPDSPHRHPPWHRNGSYGPPPGFQFPRTPAMMGDETDLWEPKCVDASYIMGR